MGALAASMSRHWDEERKVPAQADSLGTREQEGGGGPGHRGSEQESGAQHAAPPRAKSEPLWHLAGGAPTAGPAHFPGHECRTRQSLCQGESPAVRASHCPQLGPLRLSSDSRGGGQDAGCRVLFLTPCPSRLSYWKQQADFTSTAGMSAFPSLSKEFYFSMKNEAGLAKISQSTFSWFVCGAVLPVPKRASVSQLPGFQAFGE